MGACTSSGAALAEERAKELAVKVGVLRNGDKLDMRSVVMLMWKARKQPELVEVLSELVETHADEKEVFDGIEFYLPQLIHMILHLEVEWKSNFLEQFALMISQQSLHLALQMYWILCASMQDYQPEDDEGMPNKTPNPELFIRCANLQHNLEKSVVFGSPNCSQLERLYAEGKLTKEQLQDKTIEDRKAAAKAFVAEGKDRKPVMEGVLYYKRWNRTSRFAGKGWAKRRFAIQHRVLICYSENGKTMQRAIPLVHTEVMAVDNAKYQNYFEVREQKRERVWKMRASSKEEMNQWISAIQSEASAPPSGVLDSNQRLTETQIARYGFYRSERDFVRDLTDICEDLRFVPVPERKPKLRAHLEKLEIPGCVYLPMTRSTAPWYRVLRVLPEKGHPFSTRKRCPCLMTFEVVGDGDIDLANYLYQTLDQGAAMTQSSEGRRTFIKSAKLSAVVGNSLGAAGGNPEEDGSRLQVAFSDADAGAPGSVEYSIWAQELKPSASAKHATMFSGERRNRHVDLGDKALQLIKKAADGIVNIDLVNLGHQQKPTGEPSPTGEVNTVAAAMALASEEDKRTKSTRIKSMARVANPNTPVMDRIIAKSNDDLRQEMLTMLLMQFLKDVWEENYLPLYLKTYRILCTSNSTGLLEVIQNADSIDGVKKDLIKKNPNKTRFIEKFRELFPEPDQFKQAQYRYLESLAGSSLATYILALGDRHNGNIMLELDSGRLAHIDFGFVLGMRPGKDKVPYTDFSFERAPFKLTSEMVEILDGKGSALWKDFVKALVDGFMAVRAKADVLLTLLEIAGYKSMFPCFNQPGGGMNRVLREFRSRLMLDVPDSQIPRRVEKLANKAYNHTGTILYERFQLFSNKIHPIY